ncbi:Endonuclease/exonuclease/phosphatase [Xylaria arbuscula]|nr:Endonuclease/exonuclease/phosphatase [Xylaria arbuscula]
MTEAMEDFSDQPEIPWRRVRRLPYIPDAPHVQPIFGFDSSLQQWTEIETHHHFHQPRSDDTTNTATTVTNTTIIDKIALFSWNIDFSLPHPRSRMRAALAELQARIAGLPADTAVVIFLQECEAVDIETIGETGWVRTGFLRTDVDAFYWPGSYGTTTLVDRRLRVAGVFRVHFAMTDMDRDGLFVDVLWDSKSRDSGWELVSRYNDGVDGDGGKEEEEGKVMRFCNTHLESLAQESAFRPSQMALIAKFMHEESVHGALLAGDLNAIQPFDRTLHSANGLRDAYLDLGGQEDTDEGYTWGQQAAPTARERYGCCRMDKVLYCGGVSVQRFGRFGADVEVDDSDERARIMRSGDFEKAWITDHLGVFAEIVLN